jgi:hypothetical protein
LKLITLNIPLGNREQLYAAVIGVLVKAKDEKEPPALAGEQPQTG